MIKSIIARLLFIFISVFLLFGCGKEQTEEDKTTINKEDKVDKMEEDDSDDNEEQKDDSNGKTSFDNEEEESQEIYLELLENYKESSILSVYTQDNDKEYYCNALLNQDNEIEYYTVAKEEDGYYIWRYTLREGVTKEEAEGNPDFWVYKKGAAWEREPVMWLEGIKAEIDQGRAFYLRGEDKNEYAWYMASGEKSHLVKRTGDSYVEIPLSDWSITEQATVAVLANGNVVSSDAGRECYVYSQENGSLLTSFKCGWYESICVKGNIIYISTRGGNSVQRYDAEKQEFLPVIEAGFDNSVRIAQQGEDIYVCTPGGFFRARETDTHFQKVLEAGTFHF